MGKLEERGGKVWRKGSRGTGQGKEKGAGVVLLQGEGGGVDVPYTHNQVIKENIKCKF